MGQKPKRDTSKEEHNFKNEATSCPTPVEKRRMAAPKPVDEDLYKVSPQLLSAKSTKVFFSVHYLFYLISALISIGFKD